MVWMHKCVPWDKRLSLSGVHFSQVCEMRLYGRPHGKAGRARRFPLRLLSSSTPQAAPAVSFTPDEPCFLSCVFPSRPTASSRIGSASPSLASSQTPSAHGCCRTDALQLSGFRPRPRRLHSLAHLSAAFGPFPVEDRDLLTAHSESHHFAAYGPPWLPVGNRCPLPLGVPLSPSPARLSPPPPDSLRPWRCVSPYLSLFTLCPSSS